MLSFSGFVGRYHSEKYGTKPEHFAKIAYKNHKHSGIPLSLPSLRACLKGLLCVCFSHVNAVNNPYAQFQKEYTLDEILASKPIYAPLTVRGHVLRLHVD